MAKAAILFVCLIIFSVGFCSISTSSSSSSIIKASSSSPIPESPDTTITTTTQHQIEEASRILNSIGANLCHPSSTLYKSLGIPPCTTPQTPNQNQQHRTLHPEEESFILFNTLMSLLCVTLAALAAGLTMGLLSLDPLLLLIKIRASDSETEKRQAQSLLPIIQQHHRLLVTLLLLNAVANEALPLFLDELVPGYLAVIFSVTLVLFFGEIIPSAVFTGPNQMTIASKLTPIIKLIMCVLAPLAIPIAKALDKVLGHDDEMTLYNRGELTALVRILYEERLASKKRHKRDMKKVADTLRSLDDVLYSPKLGGGGVGGGGGAAPDRTLPTEESIHFDEVTMVEGALNMKTKMALDIYTPLRKVFAVRDDMELDEEAVIKIYSSGYSRIPIYVKQKKDEEEGEEDISAICGVLMTKQLMVVSTGEKRSISSMPLIQPFCVAPSINMVDLLNMFQKAGEAASKGGHLALICSRPDIATSALDSQTPTPKEAGVMGIVTLEDVIEQLLQEKIFDEHDKIEREEFRRATFVVGKWKKFVSQKKMARAKEEEGMHQQQVAMGNLGGSSGGDDVLPLLKRNVEVLRYGSNSAPAGLGKK